MRLVEINVSWMARIKSQHVSRPEELGLLLLHPILWSFPHIGLCSGGTPEDTYFPRLPRPPYCVLSQQSSPSLSDDRFPGGPLLIYRRLVLVCTCFCVPQSSPSYIILFLLCRLPRGHHPEQTQQHEIIVILGNTPRKRRVGVAPARKDAGQWRSSDRNSSEAD
jgi:hypothetical protein